MLVTNKDTIVFSFNAGGRNEKRELSTHKNVLVHKD